MKKKKTKNFVVFSLFNVCDECVCVCESVCFCRI